MCSVPGRGMWPCSEPWLTAPGWALSGWLPSGPCDGLPRGPVQMLRWTSPLLWVASPQWPTGHPGGRRGAPPQPTLLFSLGLRLASWGCVGDGGLGSKDKMKKIHIAVPEAWAQWHCTGNHTGNIRLARLRPREDSRTLKTRWGGLSCAGFLTFQLSWEVGTTQWPGTRPLQSDAVH